MFYIVVCYFSCICCLFFLKLGGDGFSSVNGRSTQYKMILVLLTIGCQTLRINN